MARISEEGKKCNACAWPFPIGDDETTETPLTSTPSDGTATDESPRRSAAEETKRVTVFANTGTSAGFQERMGTPVRFNSAEGMMLVLQHRWPSGSVRS